MGLPGAENYFSKSFNQNNQREWLNADNVRKEANDWISQRRKKTSSK